jgi:hypothetical protein
VQYHRTAESAPFRMMIRFRAPLWLAWKSFERKVSLSA